jgi:hypothetical protein
MKRRRGSSKYGHICFIAFGCDRPNFVDAGGSKFEKTADVLYG